MTYEKAVSEFADRPVGESVVPIVHALAPAGVYVPVAEAPPGTAPGQHITLSHPISIATGMDNQGRPWAYIYSSQATLLKSLPQGSPWLRMNFVDVFEMIEKDPEMAGIVIDSGSDSFYILPREVFGGARQAIGRPMEIDRSLRFVPSDVEGLPSVTEAEVFPDRLELRSDGKLVVIRFAEIARWGRGGWFWRLLARAGWVSRRPDVADRDWFHPPRRRFFRFYTNPPIVIYMPEEPEDLDYGATLFVRIQEVIRRGGYATSDLG